MTSQVIHIFKKDAVSERLPLAVIGLLTVAYTWLELAATRPGSFGMIRDLASLTYLLLPLGVVYLLVSLVHNEPLPGDRQFWITRPYDRLSLLYAKLLFVAVFVLLPLFVSDVVILAGHGISPVEHWQSLFWKALWIVIWFVLPVLALSTVAANPPQFALSLGLIAVSFLMGSVFVFRPEVEAYLGPMAWQRSVAIGILIGLVAAAVLFLQYRFRRSNTSRALVAGCVLASMLMLSAGTFDQALAVQARFAARPETADRIRLMLDTREELVDQMLRSPLVVEFQLPLRVEGLDRNQDIDFNQVQLEIAGRVSKSSSGLIQKGLNGYFERFSISADDYRALGDLPVRITHRVVYSVLVEVERATVASGVESVHVPGFGVCSSAPMPIAGVSCRDVARQYRRISAELIGASGKQWREFSQPLHSYAPFPTDLRLSPLEFVSLSFVSMQSPQGLPQAEVQRSTIMLKRWKPVAHAKRDFVIEGIDLARYRLAP